MKIAIDCAVAKTEGVLTLERPVHGGAALARVEGGRVALVRGGIPGESVEARLEERSGVLQGRVTRVLTASPDRVPASEHPGLDYSFIRYEKQLALKQEVVRDALSRALKREVQVPPVKPAPRLWHYRNAVQPAVTRGGLGYREPESHEVVLLESDPVANEAINNAWEAWGRLDAPKGVREVVFRGNDQGEVLASLVATAPEKTLVPFAHELVKAGLTGVSYAPFDARGRFRGGSERLAGARSIEQRYGDFDISVSATNFAQPNPSAAGELYKALQTLAASGGLALDVYAGSGIIGMHLAESFERVTALEINRGSVVRGERDAARLGIGNLTFIKADAKRLVVPPDTDLIAVDPPRAGLNKEVRRTLTASQAPRLVYVSCDVATWARDVAAFVASGWRLEHAQPFDFYPHTHHIEMLSLLVR